MQTKKIDVQIVATKHKDIPQNICKLEKLLMCIA